MPSRVLVACSPGAAPTLQYLRHTPSAGSPPPPRVTCMCLRTVDVDHRAVAPATN